jgi:hypothetical protein
MNYTEQTYIEIMQELKIPVYNQEKEQKCNSNLVNAKRIIKEYGNNRISIKLKKAEYQQKPVFQSIYFFDLIGKIDIRLFQEKIKKGVISE